MHPQHIPMKQLSIQQYEQAISDRANLEIKLNEVNVKESTINIKDKNFDPLRGIYYKLSIKSGDEELECDITAKSFQQYVSVLSSYSIMPGFPDSLQNVQFAGDRYIEQSKSFFNDILSEVIEDPTIDPDHWLRTVLCKPFDIHEEELQQAIQERRDKISRLNNNLLTSNIKQTVNSTIGSVSGSVKDFLRRLVLKNEQIEYNFYSLEDQQREQQQQDQEIKSSVNQNSKQSLQEQESQQHSSDVHSEAQQKSDNEKHEDSGLNQNDEVQENQINTEEKKDPTEMRGREFRADSERKVRSSVQNIGTQVSKTLELLTQQLKTTQNLFSDEIDYLKQRLAQKKVALSKYAEQLQDEAGRNILMNFQTSLVFPIVQKQQSNYEQKQLQQLNQLVSYCKDQENVITQMQDHLTIYLSKRQQLIKKQQQIGNVQSKIAKTDKNKQTKQWNQLNEQFATYCKESQSFKETDKQGQEILAKVFERFKIVYNRMFNQNINVYMNQSNIEQLTKGIEYQNKLQDKFKSLKDVSEQNEDIILIKQIDNMYELTLK